MRHVISDIHRVQGNAVEAATACGLGLLVPVGAGPGDQVEDEGPQAWCRVCLRTLRGRETEQGLHADLGELESDGEFGEAVTDEEVFKTEEADGTVGQDEVQE